MSDIKTNHFDEAERIADAHVGEQSDKAKVEP